MQAERFVADDVTLERVPDHVDPALVVDFDHMKPHGLECGDVYRALARLHDGPDIVWTPHHGGHWIATRAEDINWIQQTWDLFSSREKGVPHGRLPLMPPITYDPPDHTRYRAVFNPHFAKRRIEDHYQPKARKVIVDLIEDLRPKGACEFVSAFSYVAPIVIFFDFVDLPYDRREEFLGWGQQFGRAPDPKDRMAAHAAITGYLGDLLDARLDDPGDDIFTAISQWRANPRFQDRAELTGMAELVFLGGQDTVASSMAFAMWRLAERPELQQRLKDDRAIIPAAVEELLRRHALSNTARLIRKDIVHKGAAMKAGELVMMIGPLSGIDPRAYEDPFAIDFDRGPVAYNSLGNGPHKCVGQHLGRMELRIMLEEWAKRMPIVRFDPVMPPPSSHAGGVIGVDHLHLTWDA